MTPLAPEHECTRCGRLHSRADLEILEPIPAGRAVVKARSRCGCGAVYGWRAMFEDGRLMGAEADDG